ncbi:MAG: hypothetical protein CM1200mP18_12600 [Gammaproteobacteria bacterium]|nr:MAG: hypothetical protein CM1200mP18_12600 [Gammaproteobacteria bacterium]
MLTSKDVDSVFPVADFVVLAAPLTVETRNLFDRRRQALTKPGAGIVLKSGEQRPWISGHWSKTYNPAIFQALFLMSFMRSLYLKGSSLWHTPNLIVTPHISADDGNTYVDMTLDLVFENLERHLGGKPLINVVDPVFGVFEECRPTG